MLKNSGMTSISVWFNEKLAGILSYDLGSYSFKYATTYLSRADAMSLDPLHLPLSSATYQSHELFGVMRDALPDSWGRFALAREHGIDASRISDLDCMMNMASEGVGCIMFAPITNNTIAKPTLTQPLMLSELQDDIMCMDYQCSQTVSRLLHAGSSMGGARPKASIIHDGTHYLAKFNQRSDTLNVCRCEHAAMTLAGKLGVHVADTQLVQIQGQDVLLVQRFDRDANNNRYPFLSALTLSERSEMDFMHESYVNLNTISAGLSHINHAEEWLRRMTYNVLCNNDDDHLRNHGFIARNGAWELSPAYDIMPHAMQGETYRLAIGLTVGNRDATLENAIAAGQAMVIANAEEIVNHMRDTFIQTWQSHFVDVGVDSEDIKKFERIFQRHADCDSAYMYNFR